MKNIFSSTGIAIALICIAFNSYAARPSIVDLQVRIIHLENTVGTLQEQVSELISRSDYDSDGFTQVTGDCDDTVASTSPGAAEIPGDGIDNNCDGIIDNITIGTQVGQQSPDFSQLDTLDNARSLYEELSKSTGVVLYFTMWDPVSDSHASYIRANIIPNFPDVSFFLVDYVSGNVSYARATQIDNGYGTSEVLVDDTNHTLTNLYNANMSTTVVIDNTGIIHMNENFLDGTKLTNVLTAFK